MSTRQTNPRNLADLLPARYSEPWKAPFETEIGRRLRAGMTILDIGGGRHPAVPPGRRPERTTYVGLDDAAGEFEGAVAGAYDREIVADAATPIPGLVGTIDLAVSWQVFEHVASLEAVLRNTHAYLKPGGTLVSLFSGRWGAYAVLNRLLPARVGVPVVTRIGQRRARNAPVFSAHYDSCSFAAVRRLTAGWGAAELTPYYRGAVYFRFSRPLMRAYLAYENAVERVGWADVATHYLLVATR